MRQKAARGSENKGRREGEVGNTREKGSVGERKGVGERGTGVAVPDR